VILSNPDEPYITVGFRLLEECVIDRFVVEETDETVTVGLHYWAFDDERQCADSDKKWALRGHLDAPLGEREFVVQAGGEATTTVTESQVPWSAPEPPGQFASGLTIGFIPDGFTFVWNEGHESAVFHVFQTEDETGQVAVGRQISSDPYQAAGEQVVRGDRKFTLVEYTREIRVVEEIGGDIRVEVVSQTLDAETLLRIAESVIYNPDEDG
jgi:hypothetical protein